MLTVRAVRNTAATLGVRRACARMQRAGMPIEVALAWLINHPAVARYYERNGR